ncbi:MAG: hypothetical protein NZM43_08775 [Saprospiraceae bacterium]|nr:hypothetical protein [Saprospiraceae bacterium]MDW8484405.1 hypothetical protein [Saprospiraceae bacterium]
MQAFILLRLVAASAFLLSCCACVHRQANVENAKVEREFPAARPNYWHQGKAEISVFNVEQRRYGQLRAAQQVNIFVTEDFSARKQVKLDAPEAAGADRIPVLKLNALRRFTTGLYDYSVMMSVFSPMYVRPSHALKATWSIQDWCGQVFAQANRLSDSTYRLRLFSYFEREGDIEQNASIELLEDELWTTLRLHPARFERPDTLVVLPSMLFFRFQHLPLQTYKAVVFIEKKETESFLHVRYTDLPRQLSIRFETAWPHRILGWEEYDQGQITSRGSLSRVQMNDYWNHQANNDEVLRKELNVSFFSVK